MSHVPYEHINESMSRITTGFGFSLFFLALVLGLHLSTWLVWKVPIPPPPSLITRMCDCSVLQCVAVCCSVLQSRNQLSVLQCVCMLQYVAVCCRVLQCATHCTRMCNPLFDNTDVRLSLGGGVFSCVCV